MINTLRTMSMLCIFIAGFFGYHAYLDWQPAWMLIAIGGGGIAAAFLFWLVADFCEPLEPMTIEEEWL